ncbi:uncharacterized protein LOC124951471 isoform X1 [Vespa velutina]|uniref:uncharacterized protein LOC124951471 isoform X1 n=1 Tax=Vespa velutina TaxID=202808 RepID=UPI001FB3BF4C|nr:uncharacterized protein LOC124951471 isoform X1 [Vespa velutina]
MAMATATTKTTTTMKKKEIEEAEVKREKHESVNRGEGRKKRANGMGKKREDDRFSRKPIEKVFLKKVVPSPTKCSFHVDEEATTEMTVKVNRKLGNVIPTSNVQTYKKPEISYLEIHRRRLSLSRYRHTIRSPEGLSLSIYGDSEELDMEEGGGGRISFSDFSRDDQSELSFYRRLIERSATRLPRTTRSCETVRSLRISTDSAKSSDNFPRIRASFKSSASESRLAKKSTYKPYTIEDYRSLSVPKPDRSLGPDKEEILAKREWLMRRRSYGDSVSERNRQHILHTAQRFKSRRIAPRKCFLPSLNHRNTDPKIHKNSSITEKTINGRSDSVERKNHSNRPAKLVISKQNTTNSSRKIKKQGKSTNCYSPLNSSNHFEDSYLDSLRQRHLHEKELVDKLIKQAINS